MAEVFAISSGQVKLHGADSKPRWDRLRDVETICDNAVAECRWVLPAVSAVGLLADLDLAHLALRCDVKVYWSQELYQLREPGTVFADSDQPNSMVQNSRSPLVWWTV